MDVKERKIDKVHEELIQEEGLVDSKLPSEIRKKIKGWNLMYARFEKNNQDVNLYKSLQKRSVDIAEEIQDFIDSDEEVEETDVEKPENKSNEGSSDGGDSKEDDKPKQDSKAEDGKGKDDAPKSNEKPKEGDKGEQKSNPKPNNPDAPSKGDEKEGDSKEKGSKEDNEPPKPKPSEQKANTPSKSDSFGNLVMKKKILHAMKSERISINELTSIIGKEPDYPDQKVHDITLRKVWMANDYRLKH